MGGGSRNQVFTTEDLRHAEAPPGEDLVIHHTEYSLVNYHTLQNVVRNEDNNQIVCRLPLRVLGPKLQTAEIRDLAKLHEGIPAVSRDTRRVLLDRFNAHECTDNCEISYAVLTPVVNQAPTGRTATTLDIQSAEFAGTFKVLPVHLLRVFLTEEQASLTHVGFKVKRVLRAGTANLEHQDIELNNLPVNLLAPYLTTAGLRALGSVHGLNIPHRWAKQTAVDALQTHRCAACPSLHFILEPVVSGKPTRRSNIGAWLDRDPEPLLWEAELAIPTDVYPPRPTTIHDIAVVMKAYCKEISPHAVEESGCCVCGQLSLRTHLIPFDEATYELDILEELGSTRLERTAGHEPVSNMKGPVLDVNLKDICLSCHDCLKHGKRPTRALANHLWVGEVPECLQDLTLAECAMISRVRYNRCVVRVATGHAKMIANVVAFEHPSKKIYERLPMAQDELAEVLSIVYTGVEPPGDDDLKRTPVLVRRHKIQNALEWLKLNHRDYIDLSIDYETLGTYALESVPIGILRKKADPTEEGNVLASAKSVFDADVEQ
ncbi:hypothetical protein DFP72DRAFT_831842, partial [Ephemerocybe angulata]